MQDNIKESQNLEMSDSELSNLKRRQGKLRYLNITKDIPFKFTPPTVKNNSYKNIKSSKYFNSSDNYNNYKSTNDSNMVYSNNNHINTPQVNNPNVNSYNYQQQQQQRSMSGSYQNTYNSGNRFNKNFQYKNDRQPYNNIYNRAPQPQYQGTMNQGNNNKDDGTLSNTNLYIRNLTQETTDDSLKELCEKFGEIVSTKAIMDKQTNTCRGFGFVKFNNVEDAQKAMNGLSEQGLHVTQARVNKNGSEDNADSTNLYIANLPNGYTEDMLHALCANEGADVISTRILRDDAGESRCVGFARVESKERCEQIINKYNGKILEGTKEPLLVKLAATAKKNSKSRIYGNIHHINNYYLGQRNFSGMMRNSGMQGYPQNPIVAHPIAVENPYYNYPPPTGPMVDRQSNPNAHGMNRVSNTPHTTPRIPYPNLQAPHYPNASIPSGGPHYQVMAPGNHPQGYGTPQMMTTYQNSETPQVNQGPPSAEGTPNQVPQGYYQGYPFYQGQTYVQYGVDVQQMHLQQQQQQQNNPQYSNGTANANVSRNEGDSQQYENAGVRGGQISNNNNKEKK